MPKVSVITVVKENPLGLTWTQESLSGQSFKDWELIIVVAQKSVSTMDIAKDLQMRDSRIKPIWQTSKGIYPAMNEGIAQAIGDLIWFMNAGDRFANEKVLIHAVENFSKYTSGVLIGGYKILDERKAQAYVYPEEKVTSFSFGFNRRGGCHQAMIFKTQLIKDIGGFNTTYLLASDFDLVLRVIQKTGARRVAEVYAEIEPGGIADQNINVVHKEKHEIRRLLIGGPLVFTTSLLWTVLARAKITARRLGFLLAKSS